MSQTDRSSGHRCLEFRSRRCTALFETCVIEAVGTQPIPRRQGQGLVAQSRQKFRDVGHRFASQIERSFRGRRRQHMDVEVTQTRREDPVGVAHGSGRHGPPPCFDALDPPSGESQTKRFSGFQIPRGVDDQRSTHEGRGGSAHGASDQSEDGSGLASLRPISAPQH